MHMPQDFHSTPYPLTCAFIAGAGISPETIVLDSVTVGGYRAMKMLNGKRVLLGGEFVTEEHQWPSIEFGIVVRASLLIEQLKADGEDDRQAVLAQRQMQVDRFLNAQRGDTSALRRFAMEVEGWV